VRESRDARAHVCAPPALVRHATRAPRASRAARRLAGVKTRGKHSENPVKTRTYQLRFVASLVARAALLASTHLTTQPLGRAL
jgi:hypothetical protein